MPDLVSFVTSPPPSLPENSGSGVSERDARILELANDLDSLRDHNARLLAENARLTRDNAALRRVNAQYAERASIIERLDVKEVVDKAITKSASKIARRLARKASAGAL